MKIQVFVHSDLYERIQTLRKEEIEHRKKWNQLNPNNPLSTKVSESSICRKLMERRPATNARLQDTPWSIAGEIVAALHELGWKDTDIEAVVKGFNAARKFAKENLPEHIKVKDIER